MLLGRAFQYNGRVFRQMVLRPLAANTIPHCHRSFAGGRKEGGKLKAFFQIAGSRNTTQPQMVGVDPTKNMYMFLLCAKEGDLNKPTNTTRVRYILSLKLLAFRRRAAIFNLHCFSVQAPLRHNFEAPLSQRRTSSRTKTRV